MADKSSGKGVWLLPLAGLGLLLVSRRGAAAGPMPARQFTSRALTRGLQARGPWPFGLSPAFLDELARWESNRDPTGVTGKHRGLWQLAPVSVTDYNKRFGARFTPGDLHDPWRSLPVVKHHFATLLRSYAKAGLTPTHPEWGSLVYAGHNAGYSLAGGVARVAAAAGADKLTLANLPELARKHAKGNRHLQNSKKQAYWARVARALEARFSRNQWRN